MNLSYNSKCYRWIVKQKIIKNINLLYNTGFNRDINWNKLTKVLTSPNTIVIFKDIMMGLHKLNAFIRDNQQVITSHTLNEHARCFGTIFTTSFFNNIVCVNKVVYSEELVSLAKSITILIAEIINSSNPPFFKLSKLTLLVMDYIPLFNDWQNADKEYMMYTMAKQYLINEIKFTTPLSTNEPTNQLYLNMILREQNTIKTDIMYIGDPNIKRIFDALTSNISNFEKVEKKLYWLDVNYNLMKPIPNLKTVLNLFKETKRLMRNLILNREDMQIELDDIIDDKIIESVIEETEIDQSFYFRKCLYILEWLGKMQSASADQKLLAFRQEFELKLNNKTYFHALIPFFFNFVLNSLETIHAEKQAFINFINK